MQFDEPAHESQANAQSPLRAIEAPIDLREELEDVGKQFRRNANARIANLDDDAIVRDRRGERDLPAGLGILRGVVQEVRENLSEPDAIGFEHNRLGRQFDGEGQLRFLDVRAADVERGIEDVLQSDRFGIEAELAGCDARDFEQIVHEPDHLADLSFEAFALMGHRIGVVAAQADDFQGVEDGSEGVTQFVAERGEELVLAPVRFAQGIVGPGQFFRPGGHLAFELRLGALLREGVADGALQQFAAVSPAFSR